MPRSRAADQVREFHEAFDMPTRDEPTYPPMREAVLRIDLIKEEADEAVHEMKMALLCEPEPQNIANIAKELADILYVVYGAAEHYGLPLDDVFDEVHRSNMSKVWEDGMVRKREDGKVLKPPTYSPADIEGVLNA